MNQKNTNTLLWQADLGNGKYRNPILHSDYSDPDVIRVEDTYYMTASSFNYMPGLPILTSKDLVNWRLVNYAVKALPYEVYNKPAHAKGIWAPSIRYHKNKFYIYFGMPDEGLFMTCTDDPLSKWEPLVCVREGKGLIDSCPFWDEDGKAYLVHAYANSRIGIKSKLAVFEMNADGTRCISGDQVIFDGTKTQPTIEGPKVYKRDGMYYIFAPAGGVKHGWQTVLKSKSIYGPYEEKIVMHQGNSDVNGPHQGGLVDSLYGEEYFLHFQHKGAYGRIVHLQPVIWENGWPIIGLDGNGDGIGEPAAEYSKPTGTSGAAICEPETSDTFDTEEMKLQWQWPANYSESFYSLKNKGKLVLNAINTTEKDKVILWDSANILTQKIVCPKFQAETKMDFSKLPVSAKSGLIIIGAEYGALYAERKEEGIVIGYLESEEEGDNRRERVIEEINWQGDNIIYLRMKFYEEEECEFSYRSELGEWSIPTHRFKPQGAVWVGAKIGLFAVSDKNREAKGGAEFEYFKVRV